MRDPNKRNDFVFEIVMTAVVIAGIAAVLGFLVLWENSDALRREFDESPSAMVRNFAWLLGIPAALAGLYLAFRRTETATKQAYDSETGQYHDRFHTAAELLESNSSNSQLAGLQSLAQLNNERPKEYKLIVFELFRNYMVDDKIPNHKNLRSELIPELNTESNFFGELATLTLAQFIKIGEELFPESEYLELRKSRFINIRRILSGYEEHFFTPLFFEGCYLDSWEMYFSRDYQHRVEKCKISSLHIEIDSENIGHLDLAFVDCCFMYIQIDIERKIIDNRHLDFFISAIFSRCALGSGDKIENYRKFTPDTTHTIVEGDEYYSFMFPNSISPY